MDSDQSKEEWFVLWERAKQLEHILPRERKDALALLRLKHPDLAYKTWPGVARAFEAGALPTRVAQDAASAYLRIKALAEEARNARKKSERLLAEKQATDERPWLSGTDEPIPPGPYPKLAECTEYPLRRDCNYGENETERWRRCSFMQRDATSGTWKCGAPSQRSKV
jgi:hypothetical protein